MSNNYFSYVLYEMPQLQDSFVKNNKSMKQADILVKLKETNYGLISDIVSGFSRKIYDLASQIGKDSKAT